MVWYFSDRELQQEVKRFKAFGFTDGVMVCGDSEIVLQHSQERDLRVRIANFEMKVERTYNKQTKTPEFDIVWDNANKPVMCKGVFIETFRIRKRG